MCHDRNEQQSQGDETRNDFQNTHQNPEFSSQVSLPGQNAHLKRDMNFDYS